MLGPTSCHDILIRARPATIGSLQGSEQLHQDPDKDPLICNRSPTWILPAAMGSLQGPTS
eukprot:3123718-Pyramimonas_sp.AAC.1